MGASQSQIWLDDGTFLPDRCNSCHDIFGAVYKCHFTMDQKPGPFLNTLNSDLMKKPGASMHSPLLS